MRAGRHYQPLSYDLRLPDEAQADALQLLDASRAVVNAALVQLWPFLDEFMAERAGPAWKHVVELIGSPDPHGDRQWRCEAETAGRIMRGQAERKQVFQLIQPILSDGFIRPKAEKRPAGKNRKTIKEAIEALQKTLEDDDTAFITMQNVVEQACNYFLEQGEFPTTYEQMQGIPLLSVGLLTYAGDDGGAKGQAYRFSLDLNAGMACLLFRFPNPLGKWQWCKEKVEISLPECVIARLKEGTHMAPTLRELVKADGSRIAVLDVIVQVKKTQLADWKTVERVLGFDWGVHGLITAVVLSTNSTEPDKPVQISRPLFVNTSGLDGHQARTRRQIDELKAARATLAEDDPKQAAYEQEIRRCWPGTRPLGCKPALAFRYCLGMLPDQWRSPQNAQIDRARQGSTRPVAQLAQQHHDSLRHLAHSALQKPSGRHPLSFGAPPWHLTYLPTLRQARQDVSLRTSASSKRPREMGTLVGLRPLFLQCRPRLLRGGQHRTARRGIPDPDANHRQSKSLLRGR